MYCSVCGGDHARRQDCPGELRATGPERHGWRVAVETPYGLEAYGVLVAPSFDVWRARVITYPNILWTVPGGAVTLKFAGTTAQDFVKWLYTPEAQQIWADNGYRPVVKSVLDKNAKEFPTPPGLFTIDKLGGWDEVTTKFFDENNGIVTKDEQDLGVSTSG